MRDPVLYRSMVSVVIHARILMPNGAVAAHVSLADALWKVIRNGYQGFSFAILTKCVEMVCSRKSSIYDLDLNQILL